MNASRSVDRSQLQMYEGRPVNEDVFFDLVEQEKVAFGQPFNVQIHVQVFSFFIDFLVQLLLNNIFLLIRIALKR